MSKRIFQTAVAIVVLFGALSPLANCFDTWDKGSASLPVNDTELHLAAWFTCAGFVLVMTKLMQCIPAPTGGKKRFDGFRYIPMFSSPPRDESPRPTGSPPVVALRI